MSVFHIFLHFAVPAIVARVFFKDKWLKAWLIMVATMVVNLDHLLADPIYDPDRCSIGYHPLHGWPSIAAYAGLAARPKARLIGLGLLIHMALDGIDRFV
ncbi:DUF6122 family protein [Marinimicrobium sp. LS-A18]|uniref:DUF6122 family protein n=1 Tax=Marinimicrobium sp. LS-A18 TaxID=1381596 RepID=UPI0004668C5C|nr:DUF6122 family protein [Marinimicrobium sp. LS-A18]